MQKMPREPFSLELVWEEGREMLWRQEAMPGEGEVTEVTVPACLEWQQNPPETARASPLLQK